MSDHFEKKWLNKQIKEINLLVRIWKYLIINEYYDWSTDYAWYQH